MLTFDLEEERIIDEILSRNARRILIQLPDGLKPYGYRISKTIEEKTGRSIYLSSNPCYGGCDLAVNEAAALKCDLIIHYGHSPFIKNLTFPILYVRAKISVDKIDFLKKIENKFSNTCKIGIASTIQYIELLKNIKKILESSGFKVIIPPKMGKLAFSGQILGCEYSSLKQIKDRVDNYIIIGSKFHSLGASLIIDKPVFFLDPHSDRFENIEPLKKNIIQQRYALILKVKKLEKIGILIGLKIGQLNHDAAIKIKKYLELSGKKTAFITVNEISSDYLNNFSDFDAFVNTACPRVAIDDIGRFNKPIINEKECLVAIGRLGWKDLCENGFF